MKNEKDVLILAIESSCDETAAAVVKNGRTVLSNVINTQIAIHTEYGGVVRISKHSGNILDYRSLLQYLLHFLRNLRKFLVRILNKKLFCC